MSATTRHYPEGKRSLKSKYVAGVLKFFNVDGSELYSLDPVNKRVNIGQASQLNAGKTVNLAAASQTLTAAQSGQRFVGAVDAVFTLPAASSATKGVRYEFECGVPSSGTGLAISPAAADHIRGNGLTSVDNKDLINTGATDRVGDAVALYCDGVDGWVIESIVGTWAKEA